MSMSQLKNSPLGSIRSWHVDTEDRLRFHSVRIRYPEGLEEMISMFRICATARLFIDHMLPDLDAGIFLDTDILLMDDIKVRQFQWRNEVNWVIIIDRD